MKIAFLAVSVLCGVLLSLLTAMLQIDGAPRRHPPAPPEPVRTEAPVAIRLVGEDQIKDLLDALGKERTACAERSRALAEREQEAAARKQISENLAAELTSLRDQARQSIVQMAALERTNLHQLANVYGRMESESAAKVLSGMDKDRAAMILSLVNERRAAAILDATVTSVEKGPALAAEWTDIMRRLKAETSPPRPEGT